MGNFELLKTAIQNREVVRFIYDGFPREVEPFLIGDTRTRKLALRGFQIGGGSNSGKVFDWHLFLLDKISCLTKTGRHFSGVRQNYNPSDKGMLDIYVRI